MEQVSERHASATPASAAATIYPATKRFLDIIGSATLLLLLSPVMAAIAASIALETGLPIIYKCERLGRFGTPMTAYKFRTMRDGSHHHLEELLLNDEEFRLEYEQSRKLREDPRRTRVGIVLRRSSLDELPQLWNVLRGQMSLIGPRPYFLHELEGTEYEAAILSVRPGITGLWQVSGRSDLPLERRMELDAEYVQRRGPRLDLWILAHTLGAVVSGRGAY